MGGSLIGVSLAGDSNKPSPAIWGDCPNTLLNDKSMGAFLNANFLGNQSTTATTAAPGIETVTGAGTTVIGYAASGTYGPHCLSVATGATDNNNVTLFGEELGKIVRNSGNKFWFEARLAIAALGDAAVFVGLTTRANAITATTGMISADPSNSARAGLVAATSVGFVSKQTSSAIASFDATYAKGTGTIVAAKTAVVTPVAATFNRFGLYFNGRDTLTWFVDGVPVVAQDVDSTVDQTSYLVPVVALKNGASTAITGILGFLRAGYQDSF